MDLHILKQFTERNLIPNKIFEGGSPGLVVMGRDCRSEGGGFESRHRILDGHFLTYLL